MWYRKVFAQVDSGIIQQWQSKIQEAMSSPDMGARVAALNSLLMDYLNSGLNRQDNQYRALIGDPLSQLSEKVFNEWAEERQEQQRQERAQTGEPELDFDDVFTFPTWMQWKEEHGGLSQYDLPYLIEYLKKSYSIYNDRVLLNPPRGTGYRAVSREITGTDEANFVKQLEQQLQDKSFQMLGVDRSKLLDSELWNAEPVGDYEKNLILTKNIDWRPNNDPDTEGALLTFSISSNGIGIMAEVADPMPTQLQKQELEKFMNDVNLMPSDWSREIRYIEGGDFEVILSGKFDKDIKVYRMMSDQEYDKWQRGEVVPVGKYFATKRQFASGTDFGGEGFRDVFMFIVNRSLMNGMDENVVINDIPLRLEGQRLLPT